jgi:hypothetical protein
MWENLTWTGDDSWLAEAIAKESCIAVTNGLYMADLYPHIHSAALVIECTRDRGRLWCSFPEQAINTGSYRGKLAGLMAIHLLLLATNKVHPGLRGLVTIYFDCMSRLDKVQHLPPYWIPSRFQHSNILKNILVNCVGLSFAWHYRHVNAHQDDSTEYHLLSRESQLNCAMDFDAKSAIRALNATSLPRQQRFPLEPVCAFVGQHKLSADIGDHLRFWSHLKMA